MLYPILYKMKKSGLIFISIVTICFVSAVNAAILVSKPDFPARSAEFGQALAKNGKYIVVGADQHSEFSPLAGTSVTNPFDSTQDRNVDMGAIYLLTDDGSEAPIKYQFLKPTDLDPISTSNSNLINYVIKGQHFGSAVDISNSWIIATIDNYVFDTGIFPAVVLIPKENGQFADCPQVTYVTRSSPADAGKNWGDGIINCTDSITPIPLTGFNSVDRKTIVKVSDYHFGVAVGNTVRVWSRIYDHVLATERWIESYNYTVDAGKTISDFDLTNNSISIAAYPLAPFTQNDENGIHEWSDVEYDYTGYVQTAQWQSWYGWINGNRITTGANYPFYGFGYRVATYGDTMFVASGMKAWPSITYELTTLKQYSIPFGFLSTYKYNANTHAWERVGVYGFTSLPKMLSMDNDNLVVQLDEFANNSASLDSSIYKTNRAAIVFPKIGDDYVLNSTPSFLDVTVLNDYFPSYQQGNNYSAQDPVVYSNGKVIFGWRGLSDLFNGSEVKLSGGIIIEDINNFTSK